MDCHDSALIFLVPNTPVKAIKGRYDPDDKSEKIKTFKTFRNDIKVGDFVAVTSDTRHGVTTVKVEEIEVFPNLRALEHINWVVGGPIDMEAHKQVISQEKDLIQRMNRARAHAEQKRVAEEMMSYMSDEEKSALQIEAPKA